MNKKILVYALLPVFGLGLFGVNAAFAHGWFGVFSNENPDQVAARQQSMFDNEAQILGISVDEVKDAWAAGKTLTQIATEKGISQEQLQERMKSAREAQMKSELQILVTKGIITQAQADKRLEFMKNNPGNQKFGRGFHRGMTPPDKTGNNSQ